MSFQVASTADKHATAHVLQGGAVVVWHDDLTSGAGSLRFGLGAGGELPLRWPGSASYGPGATSPEELAAAAHASLSRAAEKCTSFGSRKVHHCRWVEVISAGQAESRSDGA